MTQSQTLYYDHNAQAFFDRTAGLDMASVRNRFTSHLAPGARVLDVGCGSGRDSRAFTDAGFAVTAFDGSAELVELARVHTGLSVQHLLYTDISWVSAFEGLWACSSLVHLQEAALSDALARLRRAAARDALFYSSFLQGDADFVDEKGRYFNVFSEDSLRRYVQAQGFEVQDIWATGHLAKQGSVWLNVLARCPS